MAVETWGSLPKAQDTPETIEEAVTAALTAHNDDPDAHLGAGQALASHRAAEIIDHLAESIVEDKFATGSVSSRAITSEQIIGKDIRTDADVGAAQDGVMMNPNGIEMWQDGERKVHIPKTGDAEFRGNVRVNSLDFTRLTLWPRFESLDAFWKTARPFSNVGYLEITTTTTLGDIQYVVLPSDEQFNFYPNAEKNPILDIRSAFSITGACEAFVSMGELAGDYGMGFKITATKIYAAWTNSLGTVLTHELANLNSNHIYHLRVEYKNNVSVKWFIDDELVYSFNPSGGALPSAGGHPMFFWCENKQATKSAKMFVYHALYQQDW